MRRRDLRAEGQGRFHPNGYAGLLDDAQRGEMPAVEVRDQLADERSRVTLDGQCGEAVGAMRARSRAPSSPERSEAASSCGWARRDAAEIGGAADRWRGSAAAECRRRDFCRETAAKVAAIAAASRRLWTASARLRVAALKVEQVMRFPHGSRRCGPGRPARRRSSSQPLGQRRDQRRL